MVLLIVLILVFLFFGFRKPAAPSLLLMAVYSVSLVCGLLIQQDFAFHSSFEAFNVFYLSLMIALMILPWSKFSYVTAISEPDPNKTKTLTNTLLVVNGLIFLLFALICYSALSEVTDFSAFKNGGESGAFIEQLPIDSSLNHTFYMLASYLSSTAYFLVPLHFYYLQKQKYLISLLCLLFSTNIILFGLTNLSRSAFVTYSLVYLFHLPFFYKKLNQKSRRVMLALTSILLAMALVPFVRITANRFSNVVAYNRATSDQNIISTPEVYSLFDYSGQWYRNSSEVMSNYSFDTLNGELTFTFALTLADKLRLVDYPPEQIERRLYSIWGDHYDKFNGLIANLLFDFGYIGTTLFVLFYFIVVRKLGPVRGELSFVNQLVIGAAFIVPAVGIFNSELKTMTFNTLVIYSLIVYWYMKSEGQAFGWNRGRKALLVSEGPPSVRA